MRNCEGSKLEKGKKEVWSQSVEEKHFDFKIEAKKEYFRSSCSNVISDLFPEFLVKVGAGQKR